MSQSSKTKQRIQGYHTQPVNAMPSMKKVPVQNAPGILQFKYEITIQLKHCIWKMSILF